ncbi:MAG: serine/threonine protein kinase, partial [Acidobacteria bacterium]|nr:serine/threonine protein kinase [Acidobacteriota bacterium]
MTDSAESWRWRRTRKILESAMDLGPEERQKYLTEACGGDEDLRRRIEALLQADGESESPLDTPVADLAVTILQRGAEASHVGRRIGAHRLISELDHGGMGTVYLAERADGEYQEKVAIKLIRPGLASHALIHRFRQERQILAQLNHPNIARILDGGMTDDGMPYFVMEFIEGERIDLYCRRLELTVEARLALFRRVCEAVHAAHRSLVVHCDLKPSNILVTAEGVPKLLDFGIARLAEPRPRQEPASGDRSEIPSAG